MRLAYCIVPALIRRPRWRVAASACALLGMSPFVGPFLLEAQILEGRVLDAQNQEPLAMARVTFSATDGGPTATVLSDAQGWFLFRAIDPGVYTLEVDRLGYHMARTEEFTVTSEGITRHDVDLVPRAIALEGIVVEARPGAIIHEPTLSGVFARRARSPTVGGNRVLVRGDPELDRQWRVRDVVPRWIPRSQCHRRSEGGERVPYMYWNGSDAEVLGPDAEAFILALPVREVEAVEYYLDVNSAPMPLRPLERARLPNGWDNIRACGIVAVWSRGAPR